MGIRAKRHEWRACANCLAGHPAFILGNGPTLPADLSTCKDYLSVGTNRILYHFDPTVLMWFEQNVENDIKGLLPKAKAIPFTSEAISGRYNGLRVNGKRDQWDDTPLAWPDWVPATGSSGVCAAHWAMSLGCSPIYLLGMSAEYVGTKTSSYGVNKYHDESTMPNLQRALGQLLTYANVFPIQDQAQLERITMALTHKAKGREYYLNAFAACHDRALPPTSEPVGAKPLSIESAILGKIVAEADETPEPVGPRGKLRVKPCDIENRQKGNRGEAITEFLKVHCPEPTMGAEIGVWQGRTTACLLQEFPGLTMYMVDPWPDSWPEDGRYYQQSMDMPMVDPAFMKQTHNSAMKATEFAADRRIVLRGMSMDMAPAVPDGTLDFVFLDGDHSKEGLAEDLGAWWRKVRSGGIVCGHDWEHPEYTAWGVREAVKEFVELLGRDVTIELGADLTWYIIKDE